MIGQITLAIELGADARDIGKATHPHPTLGEKHWHGGRGGARELHRPAAGAQAIHALLSAGCCQATESLGQLCHVFRRNFGKKIGMKYIRSR
ncbi:hypothetical protein [Polaromonas sp.]|uniref:hypothetical protein n=1 Tax=Polaromonas sp. TaxID=1869339 RepID=UPI0027344C2D|nr:hypothetical protein [Polaromonas sp.]